MGGYPDMTTNFDPTDSSYPRANSGDRIAPQIRPNTIHRIRQRIQLQIPPQYSQEPVISALVNRYEVEVNILSALLATNSKESGWFDLELYATPARIQEALAYLSGLQVEIWMNNSLTGERLSFA
jgi:ABC-type methionine transport system ATPase subunit